MTVAPEFLFVRQQSIKDGFAVVVQLGRQTDVLQNIDERRGQILVAQQAESRIAATMPIATA